MSLTPDVLVLGGGPGGYVAALRAAQLGLSVTCVERDATLGGTCVTVGCIPSKAMLQSSEHFAFARDHAASHGVLADNVRADLPTMLRRKTDVVASNTRGIEFLFKKHKVAWAKGHGTVVRVRPDLLVEVAGTDGTTTAYAPRHLIIATGSVPIGLPFLPFDEERILSNVGGLAIPQVPKRLLVVGGGYIGLEMGSVWRRLGAEVVVIEATASILPGQDADIQKEAAKVFAKQGLVLRTGTKVVAGGRTADGVTLTIEADGAREELTGDHVLVAIGRRPSLSGVDPAALGLAVTERGLPVVDAQLRTSVPTVFAIGDCIGGKMLAHKAEEEGVIAAEAIAGHASRMHYGSIPGVVYTWPEIATVGLPEHEVRASGRAYTVGRFPFSANGRARTMGESTGFVKVITDATTGELLGAHLLGPNVSEMVGELVLAFEYRGTAEDLAMTVHAHPTLSEAIKEAALAAEGRALHV